MDPNGQQIDGNSTLAYFDGGSTSGSINLSAGLASGDVVAYTPIEWLRQHQAGALLLGGALAFVMGHKTLGYILGAVGAGLWLLAPPPQPQAYGQINVQLPLSKWF